MAIYYLRTDGNDSNTGTGPATSQAWATLGKALGSTGIKSGDILYIAPGKHTCNGVTTAISPNPSALTRIIGDVNSLYFSDILPGEVRFNHYTTNDNTAGIAGNMLGIGNDYLSFENINFAGYANQNNAYMIYNSGGKTNLKFYRCKFYQASRSLNVRSTVTCEGYSTDTLMNLTIDSCVFFGASLSLTTPVGTTNTLDNTKVINNLFISPISFTTAISITSSGSTGFVIGQVIANNIFIACSIGIQISTNPFTTSTLNTTYCYKIVNNLFTLCGTTISAAGGNRQYSYIDVNNRHVGGSRSGSFLSDSSLCSDGYPDLDLYSALQLGYDNVVPFAPRRYGVNSATGSATGSTQDYFGSTWTTAPSIGPFQLNSVTGLSYYQPIEKNVSYLNVAYGSTSQSINVYLGGTGISYNTSGLQASYTRQNSAPVGIGLTWQTPTGSWKSGGFIEVNSSTAPGLYRLDVPNAAFASGTSSVAISIRGAAGTNGAYINVNLSNVQAQLDLTQTTGSTTVGDALNSANSGGVGKWSISGDLLYLYAADGSLTKKLRVKNLRIDV